MKRFTTIILLLAILMSLAAPAFAQQVFIDSQSKSICSGLPISYNLNVKNTQNTVERYFFSINDEESASIEPNVLILGPQEDNNVVVFMKQPRTKFGEKTLNVIIESNKEKQIISLQANILNCYNFNLIQKTTSINKCSGIENILVDVENTAPVYDQFTFTTEIDGDKIKYDPVFVGPKTTHPLSFPIMLDDIDDKDTVFTISAKSSSGKTEKIVEVPILKSSCDTTTTTETPTTTTTSSTTEPIVVDATETNTRNEPKSNIDFTEVFKALKTILIVLLGLAMFMIIVLVLTYSIKNRTKKEDLSEIKKELGLGTSFTDTEIKNIRKVEKENIEKNKEEKIAKKISTSEPTKKGSKKWAYIALLLILLGLIIGGILAISSALGFLSISTPFISLNEIGGNQITITEDQNIRVVINNVLDESASLTIVSNSDVLIPSTKSATLMSGKNMTVVVQAKNIEIGQHNIIFTLNGTEETLEDTFTVTVEGTGWDFAWYWKILPFILFILLLLILLIVKKVKGKKKADEKSGKTSQEVQEETFESKTINSTTKNTTTTTNFDSININIKPKKEKKIKTPRDYSKLKTFFKWMGLILLVILLLSSIGFGTYTGYNYAKDNDLFSKFNQTLIPLNKDSGITYIDTSDLDTNENAIQVGSKSETIPLVIKNEENIEYRLKTNVQDSWIEPSVTDLTVPPQSEKEMELYIYPDKQPEDGDYTLNIEIDVGGEEIIESMKIELRRTPLKEYLWYALGGLVLIALILLFLNWREKGIRLESPMKEKVKVKEKIKKKEKKEVSNVTDYTKTKKIGKILGIILIIAVLLGVGYGIYLGGSIIGEKVNSYLDNKNKNNKTIIEEINESSVQTLENSVEPILITEPILVPIRITNENPNNVWKMVIGDLPEWIKPSELVIEIPPNESKLLELFVNPTDDVKDGMYSVGFMIITSDGSTVLEKNVVLNIDRYGVLDDILYYIPFAVVGIVLLSIGIWLMNRKKDDSVRIKESFLKRRHRRHKKDALKFE